jgi:hypothetical protein
MSISFKQSNVTGLLNEPIKIFLEGVNTDVYVRLESTEPSANGIFLAKPNQEILNLIISDFKSFNIDIIQIWGAELNLEGFLSCNVELKTQEIIETITSNNSYIYDFVEDIRPKTPGFSSMIMTRVVENTTGIIKVAVKLNEGETLNVELISEPDFNLLTNTIQGFSAEAEARGYLFKNVLPSNGLFYGYTVNNVLYELPGIVLETSENILIDIKNQLEAHFELNNHYADIDIDDNKLTFVSDFFEGKKIIWNITTKNAVTEFGNHSINTPKGIIEIEYNLENYDWDEKIISLELSNQDLNIQRYKTRIQLKNNLPLKIKVEDIVVEEGDIALLKFELNRDVSDDLLFELKGMKSNSIWIKEGKKGNFIIDTKKYEPKVYNIQIFNERVHTNCKVTILKKEKCDIYAWVDDKKIYFESVYDNTTSKKIHFTSNISLNRNYITFSNNKQTDQVTINSIELASLVQLNFPELNKTFNLEWIDKSKFPNRLNILSTHRLNTPVPCDCILHWSYNNNYGEIYIMKGETSIIFDSIYPYVDWELKYKNLTIFKQRIDYLTVEVPSVWIDTEFFQTNSDHNSLIIKSSRAFENTIEGNLKLTYSNGEVETLGFRLSSKETSMFLNVYKKALWVKVEFISVINAKSVNTRTIFFV